MYVISMKRVKDIKGNDIPEDKQEFEYLMMYKGKVNGNKEEAGQPVSIPCFGAEKNALTFDTVGDAKNWMRNNGKILLTTTSASDYDTTTLAVRKKVYKNIMSLKLA